MHSLTMHGTTILCVRKGGRVAVGGDGQVTLGDAVVKTSARKIHRLAGGRVIAGFAGATADAFTLLERFEKRLESNHGRLGRAAEDLARDWRTDRVLRRLEAMMIIADKTETLVLSGLGDVLSPEHDIAAIGSGAGYAESAARALSENTDLSARRIVETAMLITADICIYTNTKIKMEEIDDKSGDRESENPASGESKPGNGTSESDSESDKTATGKSGKTATGESGKSDKTKGKK